MTRDSTSPDAVRTPLRVRALTADDGMDIAMWRYPGAWAVYDGTEPRADEGYRAVEDAGGRLVGFCCLGAEARVPGLEEKADVLDISLGLRPDLTGRGQGAEFARAVVAHARSVAPDARLRCVVPGWNHPSLRVARAAGFVDVGTHEVGSGASAVRYVVLEQV